MPALLTFNASNADILKNLHWQFLVQPVEGKQQVREEENVTIIKRAKYPQSQNGQDHAKMPVLLLVMTGPHL